MRFTLLLLAAALGCDDPEPDPWKPSCMPPAQVTYSCAPSAAGMPGCAGPTWTTNAGETRHEDPSLTYAIGCELQLTECSPFYPGSVRTMTCEGGLYPDDGGLAPYWVEPL